MNLSSFGVDILQGFFGTDQLKDYSHASRTFRTNNYQLTPRSKYLFHCYFNLNTAQIPALRNAFSGSTPVTDIGLLVKTADLPSYQITNDTLNQYNRKRVVQTKINYQPVTITLHDDQSDFIRNLWYNYYTYYYKDPSYPYENIPNTSGSAGQSSTIQNGFGYNTADTYTNRQDTDWGFIGEGFKDSSTGTATGQNNNGKPRFFNDITIYGLAAKRFASYIMINPIITDWKTDQYDYSQGGGTMAHTLTIAYEAVKYNSGPIGGAAPSSAVKGFADPTHYDTTKSKLSRPGGTATVFGQGGLLDAVDGFTNDLQALASGQGGLQNILGAVQNAGTAINTFQNVNIGQIAGQEAQGIATSVLGEGAAGSVRQAINAGNGLFFPQANNPVTGRPNNYVTPGTTIANQLRIK
jgi:hypothetical protein